jgi:2-hydroxychromene-2-carboxylate isomerase
MSASGVLYFDVVSPFAYLMHERLKQQCLPLALEPRPVLFAAILNAFGQKGPAEIASKRTFTYQQCTWLAEQAGIKFVMPAAHPFNPVRYLRLVLALDCKPDVIDAVFATLFASGLDPQHPATWKALIDRLEIFDAEALIAAPEVKQKLRHNTDEAIARGVFGVPTVLLDERLFWGVDSLPMLAAYLADDGSLETPAMQAARLVRVGATREP